MYNTEGCKPFTGNRAKKVPFVILFPEIDFFVFIFLFIFFYDGCWRRNPRPPIWETNAIPLNYTPVIYVCLIVFLWKASNEFFYSKCLKLNM